MTTRIEKSSLMDRIEKEKQQIKEKLSKIKWRIVVYSGKGGVGKSTISAGLAYGFSKIGKTGILDADITGPNIFKMIGAMEPLYGENNEIIPVEVKGIKLVSLGLILPEGQPVIWRGPLRTTAVRQFIKDVRWGELDFLIADLPPGTGDEAITALTDFEPHSAVVVTTPQRIALMDAQRSIVMARNLGIKNVYVIENMSYLKCPKCGHEIDLYGRGRARELAEKMNAKFVGEVPLVPELIEAADNGKLLETLESTDIGHLFENIAREILENLKEAKGGGETNP
ncbi:MAG: ATP-binding protein [Thermoplasmata archaeon]|nr:Mrp/NBP35 family ATP-binding protein [Euryarchaeota archaeon]RLF66663.1 MAG: ATP-binding protein [Thermoplasmata archaeon]